MEIFIRRLSVLCSAFLLSIICANSAVAAPIVMAGSDYFKTTNDTFFDFDAFDPSFGLGNIVFEGVQNGPGGSDTQVNRLQDADLTLTDSTPGSDTIDIELVALSLKSLDTINIGGDVGNIFIELNTSDPSKNLGTMTINGDITGGTFDSTFNVFVDIFLGSTILVSGVDLGNYASNPVGWIYPGSLLLTTGEVVHVPPTAGMHTVEQVHVPEPTSLLLLSLGLIPLVYRRKNKA